MTETASFRNASLSSAKLPTVWLLLTVVSFLWIKFICLNCDWAKSLFKVSGPPKSANKEWLSFRTIPRDDAKTVHTETALPFSLVLFMYSCIFSSVYYLSRTRLPVFLLGEPTFRPHYPYFSFSLALACTRLWSNKLLTQLHFSTAFERTLAASATSRWQAYSAISR